MTFVIAYVERSVVRFCKCSQITNHIVISPSCKFLTIFFYCRVQTLLPHQLLACRTATFIHKRCIIPNTISWNCFQHFSELLFQKVPVRCIHTKIFIKACFKISFSLVILKCSIFVNTNPFRMLISHSFIPSDRCVQIYLNSSLPASLCLFTKKILMNQSRMNHFRKFFGIVIEISMMST